LAEYVDAHADDQVTEALNEVYAHEPAGIDEDLAALQAVAIDDEGW